MIFFNGYNLNTYFIEFVLSLKYISQFLQYDLCIDFQKKINSTSKYVYNTEQLILNERLNPIIEFSKNNIILDYSQENIKILKKHNQNCNTILVPVLFDKNSMLFPKCEKEYDIIFLGATSDRRLKILNKLKDYKICILDNVFDINKKYELILKSKIFLNIHSFDESKIFEFSRCSVPVFNSQIVISEDSIDNLETCQSEINKFVLSKVIFSPYEELVDKIKEVLNNYDKYQFEIDYDHLQNINKIDLDSITDNFNLNNLS